MNHTELDQYLEIIKVCLIESGAKINKWREKLIPCGDKFPKD